MVRLGTPVSAIASQKGCGTSITSIGCPLQKVTGRSKATTVLSTPLGVPWWMRSVSYTIDEITAASRADPRCSLSARTIAVATAAPLPSPLATGIVDRIVSTRATASTPVSRCASVFCTVTLSGSPAERAEATSIVRPMSGA